MKVILVSLPFTPTHTLVKVIIVPYRREASSYAIDVLETLTVTTHVPHHVMLDTRMLLDHKDDEDTKHSYLPPLSLLVQEHAKPTVTFLLVVVDEVDEENWTVQLHSVAWPFGTPHPWRTHLGRRPLSAVTTCLLSKDPLAEWQRVDEIVRSRGDACRPPPTPLTWVPTTPVLATTTEQKDRKRSRSPSRMVLMTTKSAGQEADGSLEEHEARKRRRKARWDERGSSGGSSGGSGAPAAVSSATPTIVMV